MCFRIRDFFNDAEPDAFALRATPDDEFAAGGLEPRAGFVPRLGEVASQAANLPAACAFFGIYHLLIRVADRQPGRAIPSVFPFQIFAALNLRVVGRGLAPSQVAKPNSGTNLYCIVVL
jgi:hypothetical protein